MTTREHHFDGRLLDRCEGCGTHRVNATDPCRPPLTGTRCSVCLLPQWRSLGGDTCDRGHGGAPPVDLDDGRAAIAVERERHLEQIAHAEQWIAHLARPGEFAKMFDPSRVDYEELVAAARQTIANHRRELALLPEIAEW